MSVEKFTDLQVWQEAHQLVLHVYDITRKFPNAANMHPNPFSPISYSLQGADAVDRWCTEEEVKEVVEFANRMAV